MEVNAMNWNRSETRRPSK